MFTITHMSPVTLPDDHPSQIPWNQWPEKFTQSHLIELDKPHTIGGKSSAPSGDLFRLYDDDGNLYAQGMIALDDDDDGFEPLDWAMGNWGCTEIRYHTPGKGWVTL